MKKKLILFYKRLIFKISNNNIILKKLSTIKYIYYKYKKEILGKLPCYQYLGMAKIPVPADIRG